MRAWLVGEGMIELSRDGAAWRLGHGGDTLNTAIHLARMGHEVAYLTALGEDPFSQDLRTAWIAEGLDGEAILTDPARLPGLYAIHTDPSGERSFSYWRDQSAARGMFALPAMAAALARARTADLIGLSLISLAILPPQGREAIIDLCGRARRGGTKFAFDSNYRPRLWPSVEAARLAWESAVAVCDFGLPSLDDETALWGDADAASVAARWRDHGAGEGTVKLGAAGAADSQGEVVPPPAPITAVDTSGAGDAFNAGYLSARMSGAPARAAILAGHRLAAWVAIRPGAIPPRDRDAPYR